VRAGEIIQVSSAWLMRESGELRLMLNAELNRRQKLQP